MTILIIDGQGGNIGRQLALRFREAFPEATIHGVGTNSAAAAGMLKGGADTVATGENAVVVACRRADLIVGPVGIAIADSLLGEVTEKMAQAVGASLCPKILIPLNRCDTLIAGIGEISVTKLLEDAVEKAKKLFS